MSSEQNISCKKSFTPKSIIYPKEKKHYLNEIDNSTESTDQKYETKALLKSEKIIGNYSLTKKLSRSSYTKIFLAKHILTGEDVHIRIINKQLFKNDLLSMTRFNKELQIIKTIKHPNIIKLLEIIETNSKIYLISEYLPHSLLSYIKSEKKLSENKARLFFHQLISALNYLHLMGIAHRNINPENILLDEKYTKIKITGFGVSTFCKGSSLLNSPVGTLLFAPPEMILSQKYKGELNDIWDTGIVLYAMVCGSLPFCDNNQDVNINHIIEGFYDIPKDISSNCVEVIKACLECNPEKRITFNKLKYLKWIKHKNFEYIKGININKEKIIVDEIILQECKKYISANNQDILNKIKRSVIENKFDEFSSLYYLVLQKQLKKGYHSIFELNKNNLFLNYINITNSNEENNNDKEDISNHTPYIHTNSYSSFINNRNKLDFFDISNNINTNIINKHMYYQTIKNFKNRNNVANLSSLNFRNKKYLFSPKNNINTKNNHKKVINKLKSSELKVNKIEITPKVYTKKTSFIEKPKFLNIKSKSNYKIEKNITKFSFASAEKVKSPEEKNEKINNINNNNDKDNNLNNKNEDNPSLNTLFVNRVKNINNNHYCSKRKNKSSEGFYINSKNNNCYNTKTNLISINKRNLFININNNELIKDKNENNIDKILMDDQPVINFSMNFNNTLLNNNKNISNELNKEELTMNNFNNKNISNELNKEELTMNNINKNETNYINKQSVLKIEKKNVKSYKRLDYFFQTPKKIKNDSNYFNYNHKYNLKNNHYFKLNSSNKVNISITDSFNKFFPTKKFIGPSALRNKINDQYYNTTFYQEEKTLNKIRSFGGIKNTQVYQDNNYLQKHFGQNTFSLKNKNVNSNNIIINDKKYSTKKENKKTEKNNIIHKNNIFSENINMNEVFDLSCLKFCLYEDLINKICKILKKHKIKYCFINHNKIHCSINKAGIFFDIELKNFKTKKSNKNIIKKIEKNNINIYKDGGSDKNNRKVLPKMGYTSSEIKKKNDNKSNELYYINFCCKANNFKNNYSNLIHDILY